MRYPAFAAEMALPARRPNLWFGIWSGYLFAAGFAILAFIGGETDVVPHRPAFYALLCVKLVTNSLAWWSLRRDAFPLVASGLNLVADLVLMTGAIHLTGGPLSPLFPAYVIEVTVVALVTNRGLTIVVGALSWAMHTTASLLVLFGILEAFPPPSYESIDLDTAQTLLGIAYAAFILGVTTAFSSGLVERLERRKRELEERTQELIDAQQQRTLLMANVTHELRTPIHGICGLSEVLDAGIYGDVTEAQKKAHGDIRGSARSLLRMIDDLLTLTRGEADALELRIRDIDLQELLDSVTGSVRWMMGTKQLRLTIHVDPNVPPLVTDRGKLGQVLVNLLTNAVKFTPERGEIELRVRAVEDGIVFDIVDTGIGIAEEEVARVLEPFVQVDGGDERAYGGTGLGLSIVARLVDLLEGRLSIASEVDKGTTFTIWLPPRVTSKDESDVSGAQRIA